MKRYLPDNKIKEMYEYIEKVFSKKNRQIYKRIMTQIGDNLGIDWKQNVQNYREWCWTQFRENDKENFKEVLRLRHLNSSTYEDQIEQMFQNFVKKNYKEESEIIWTPLYDIIFNINNSYSSVGMYNVEPLHLNEIIENDDLEKYLFEKYGKKSVDDKLLQRTQRIKKNIDDFFQGVSYDVFYHSMLQYLKDKDEIKLHNNLNK